MRGFKGFFSILRIVFRVLVVPQISPLPTVSLVSRGKNIMSKKYEKGDVRFQ